MNSLSPQTRATAPTSDALLGLARLMPIAFQGMSLAPLAEQMMQRAKDNEHDANAWMDLSTILMLQGIPDVALVVQAQALQIRRTYELMPDRQPAIRLLALMTAGDLMTNSPLAFLVEHSDIALTTRYVLPGETIPTELPEHDVLFVAISQFERTDAILHQLDAGTSAWKKPVLNRPAAIARTCRSRAFRALEGSPGLRMMSTVRTTRAQLASLAASDVSLEAVLPGGVFPLIVRPVDSHAGHGLDKVDGPQDIAAYLEAMPDEHYFISRFVDYRSADGLYRKYRIALIDGRPYAAHMGISEHWMIHYLNAGMTESAAKRADEKHFMDTFDVEFAPRHAAALQAIHERLELDYLVIDCAETRDGELLAFEMDPSAVVHSMDPVDQFPYKAEHMEKIYAAFRAMLLRASASAR
jgi:glutathione synthase/RimK-type ligase-like ATP-grasp enzyme